MYRNHKLTALFSSKTDEWATPNYLFKELDNEFGLTLDPCADASNAKCANFFTKEQDGLKQDWSKHRVFCNPPYGRKIGLWVQKMATCGAEVAVGLLPSRTDTRWFHAYILNKAEIRFIKGRIKFGGGTNSAPFPSMIVVWR
jgi:site-specific DNA-methyltransferase (adenine-specific)